MALLVWLLWLSSFSTATAYAVDPRFLLTTIDGRQYRAAAVAIDESGRVSLRDPAPIDADAPPSPATDSLDVSQLSRIERLAAAAAPPAATSSTAPGNASAIVTIYPAAGGWMRVRLAPAGDATAGGSPRIRAATEFVAAFDLPMKQLAGVRFGTAQPAQPTDEFEQRLRRRDASRDQLIVRTDEGVTAFFGALESLTPAGWTFRTDARTLSGDLSRAVGIVLAKVADVPPRPGATLNLGDAGIWPADVASADDSGVAFAAPGGQPIRVPWSAVMTIDFRSDRVAWLSDLEPVEAEGRGFFGAEWPWRRDRSVTGGTLRIGRRTLARGLGVHSRSRLTFDVPEGFDALAAVIGIDAAAGGRGDVVFCVLDGERVLFDSGPVRAADAPREIVVELVGARRVTLLVDFGDGLDVGDHADWGEARFLRR
ncbi:MAG: NPCBM/NEW2 domain-containing protein [Phycisphaerae bacterium]|nr:NPCBM/NEW2 domain-containing protein [Phycisphaerae bacterium]